MNGQAARRHAHSCAQVARILSVDLVENSEKLYKLSVDVGSETRQVRLQGASNARGVHTKQLSASISCPCTMSQPSRRW